MATLTTSTELQKMTAEDLRKEIRSQQTIVAQLRMGVKMGKEKDSAKYIRERKQLARMKTALNSQPLKARNGKNQDDSTSASASSSVSSTPTTRPKQTKTGAPRKAKKTSSKKRKDRKFLHMAWLRQSSIGRWITFRRA